MVRRLALLLPLLTLGACSMHRCGEVLEDTVVPVLHVTAEILYLSLHIAALFLHECACAVGH